MRHPIRTSHVILLTVLALALVFQTLPIATVAQDQDDELLPAYVPGQLIIAFQPWVTEDEIAEFYEEHNLTQMDDLDPSAPEESAELVLAFVPADVTPTLLDTLARDPRVRYAEPNFIVQIAEQPDDPDFDKLWGMNNTGQTGGASDADIDAVEGWEVTTGSSSVIVVVIDSGVDYTHEDLADNMWKNPGECPAGNCEKNGVDDDENGYVDDFHGVNTITDSGDPMDDFGHGTHVAGTIGAVGDNGVGVTGVNWDVKIIGCKFLGASGGGTVSGAVKCFNYVNELKNEQNQKIIATNNSWGGAASQALLEAMEGENQPLHICAAGNGGSDQPHYPAAFDLDNIISVAATDHSDLYAGFSNYGPTVDLAAPGDEIYSTVPTGNCNICDPSGYTQIGGTSMAAPHVTGAAALIAAKYSTLTLQQIRQRILTGVDPLADESKSTVTNGRLNLLNSLEDDKIPPAAVNDLAASKFFMTQVELTWTATGDDGMSGQANKYDVRYSTAPLNPENWESAQPAANAPVPGAPGDKEKFIVSGLEPNNTYYFGVRVLDNVGNSSDLSNIVIGKTTQGTIVFEDNVENGEGDWEVSGDDALWHISQHRANSPTHAWYYGDEDTRTYDTGATTKGWLTSPPIALTTNEDVLLQYYEWSEVETSPAYDRTRVQLSPDEGKTWETVFESHGTNGEWVKRAVSLTPFVGDASVIQVRFWFDSTDNRFNTFEGWYVDDITLLESTPALPGAGPAQANLFIQEDNIGFSNANPVAGSSVEVTALVVNNGSADAEQVRVQFREVTGETSVPIGPPQTIASIGVGSSGTAQVTYEASGDAGDRTIEVTVDPFNLIPEANESDNQASRTLTVEESPAANLVIAGDNISFSPLNPAPGQEVTVRAVVLNDGALQAANIDVQFVDATNSSSTVPIGVSQRIDLLAPGESGVVSVTYDTTGPAEDRKIRVVVDPQNAITESDKDDNQATATLELFTPPLANLSVDKADIGFDPAEPFSGDDVTVSATIFNEGDVAAENVTVQFADVTGSTPRPLGEAHVIAAIPPGASAVAQIGFSTRGRSGEVKIEVHADPQNFIAESSEFDNKATATLPVTAAPIANLNMVSDNIGVSPSNPSQGEQVTIRAAVLNDGSQDAAGVIVQFLDVTGEDAVPIGEKQLLDLVVAGSSAVAEITYVPSGPAGTHNIEVSVDPNNFIEEANEEDNSATRTVTIASSEMANLSMLASNITFEPPTPTDGDEVTIRAVVLNTGATVAESVLVQFVDVTNGAFDPIGVEQTLESVPAGGSATAQVAYDTAGKTGNRRIQLLVDSNNLVPESDENDNDAVASLGVSAPPLPNLAVMESGVGFNPLTPADGDQVLVTVSVQNRGEVDAENVVVQVLDVSEGENVPVGSVQTIESIPAGGIGSVEVLYDAADKAGVRQLRVLVDPSNFIAESDETDNRATAALVVDAEDAPNLVVQSRNIGFSPLAPVDGDSVTLTVTILNNGSADAADVLVQFVDVTDGGADPIGRKQTIALLASGDNATVSVTYDTATKAGERRIRVVADPHMTIAEVSEMDNEAVAVLDVAAAPLPNLVAAEQNIGFSNANPGPGEQFEVTATVLNNGSAPAENVVVQFVDATDDGGVPIGASQVISSIPDGGSAVAQIPYMVLSGGEHKLQVIVDPNNLIRESDENDNAAVATLAVRSLPIANLRVSSSSIGFDPMQATPDSTAQVHATVRNDGGKAAGEVLVQFLDVTVDGSSPIGEPHVIESVAAGSSAVASVVYDLAAFAAGAPIDRKIQVLVDPNNVVPESSESDNQATATLSMVKPPSASLVIVADNITFSDPAPVDGVSILVSALVLNIGDAAATDVNVQFSDATDSDAVPIGPQQVIPSISAGGSATIRVLYDTTGKTGDRKIKVTVDPNNFIPEPKKSDNTATRTLEVREADLPNLVVSANNIGLKPPAPTDGEQVTVQAAVFNHGAAGARDVVVQFMDITEGNPVPVGAPQLIPRLATGSSGTAQVLYDTAGKQGARIIQVTADPNNFIRETNEEDNAADRALTVSPPPAPNLVALSSNVEFDPSEPSDGDLVTIRGTVINNGTATASDIVVEFTDVTGGAPAGTMGRIGQSRLIDSLQPAESATVEVRYDVTGKKGDRSIQFAIDPNNTIAESDETDNKTVAILTVAPPPAANLVMNDANIKFTPAEPTAGTEVIIAATVLNEGVLDANNVQVEFFDITNGNPQAIGTPQNIAAITAGGSGGAEVAYDSTGKEGERKIQVVVDANDLVVETSEEDNEAEATLTVLPEPEEPEEKPNLTLTSESISFDPPAPQPGDAVTVTATISNTGEGDAADVVVRFLDETAEEAVQIGEDQTIASITAGSSADASVVYTTTNLTGDRTITVVADPEGTIDESDEDDNEASATLPLGGESETLDPRPNLVVSVIGGDPAVSMQDGVLTVAAMVQNRGTTDARDVTVTFGASPAGAVIPLDAPFQAAVLAPGEELRVEARYGAEAGAGLYSFHITADPDNRIQEADEGDNAIRAEIRLP